MIAAQETLAATDFWSQLQKLIQVKPLSEEEIPFSRKNIMTRFERLGVRYEFDGFDQEGKITADPEDAREVLRIVTNHGKPMDFTNLHEFLPENDDPAKLLAELIGNNYLELRQGQNFAKTGVPQIEIGPETIKLILAEPAGVIVC